MTTSAPFAGLVLAVVAALASGPASAAIIRGYADFYVVGMRGSVSQYGDDTQAIEWGRCQGLCAKVRFEFRHDTAKPPHDTRIGLRLLKAYQDWLLPTTTLDGARYLPLPVYSYNIISDSYPLMGPSYEFGEYWGAPEAWRSDEYGPGYVDLGGAGGAFRFDYRAHRTASWGERPCAPDELRYADCWNLDRETPARTDAGPFFARYYSSRVDEDLSVTDHGGTLSFWSRVNEVDRFQPRVTVGYLKQIRYVFDNDPANWIDGPPEARSWVVGVPEPTTAGLLGSGLAALGLAHRGRRR